MEWRKRLPQSKQAGRVDTDSLGLVGEWNALDTSITSDEATQNCLVGERIGQYPLPLSMAWASRSEKVYNSFAYI